ncbi:Tn3 family transposase [Nocardia sp. NPDC051463]|uniref:Tn3 family transposase n=1 Tax=Nocardia sp. NPDC051463 TaxID=3154845 RepID=UPI00344D7358
MLREVGRSVTVALLRYPADPALRSRVTAATNKVESCHGLAEWLSFDNNGVLADNDPEEQEKLIKFNTLLANCVKRLGAYTTDEPTHQPDPFDPTLTEVDFTSLGLAV